MARRRKKNKVKVVERKLGREKAWGLCWPDGLIEIEKRTKGKRRLRILCHEIGHRAFPSASETAILRFEKIIADVLWEQGYRQVDI